MLDWVLTVSFNVTILVDVLVPMRATSGCVKGVLGVVSPTQTECNWDHQALVTITALGYLPLIMQVVEGEQERKQKREAWPRTSS